MKYLCFIRHSEKYRESAPPPALMEAMGKFVQQSKQDGTLVDTGGLLPSKEGARVRLAGGKITVTDLQGGTFTITNGGVFGSLLSTPILNPPQSGILGMHTIQKRPVVVDDQIVIRDQVTLSFTFDHRIADGVPAARFLQTLRAAVESPGDAL